MNLNVLRFEGLKCMSIDSTNTQCEISWHHFDSEIKLDYFVFYRTVETYGISVIFCVFL